MLHVKKNVRGNQRPFFDKELSKAIMTRTKLRNISYKIRVRKIERFKQNKETSTALF